MQTSTPPFAGFDHRAFTFYQELAEHNDRPWFTAHRHVYDEQVRAPMEALLAEVAAEFGDGRVYRPSRDVRFTRDASPYKDHCGALIQPEGLPWAHYLQIGGQGLSAASGAHYLSRDQVTRLREAVADERAGTRLDAVLGRARATGLRVQGSTLRTAPRGWTQDHPRIALLRHTSLSVHQDWVPQPMLGTRGVLTAVTAVWRAAAALDDWLAEHVGTASERAGPG